jgi:gamma-glutamylcyclotransferase (GGCT)/AIG2-like uncharacterized protein YtfP
MAADKKTITKHKKIANGQVLLAGSISLGGKRAPKASRTSRPIDASVVVPAIVPGYASRTGATIAKYLPEILRAKELITAHAKELGILGQSSLKPVDAFGNPIQMGYAESQFSTVIRSLHGKPDFKDIPAPDPKFRYDLIKPLPQDTRVARALRHLGYIHYLEQMAPIFVYGSFRTGQPDYLHLVDNEGVNRSTNHEISVMAEAMDLALYDVDGEPYAVRDKQAGRSFVTGEVFFTTRDEAGYQLRKDIDRLQGFDPDNPAQGKYKREMTRIHFMGTDEDHRTSTPAWIYTVAQMSDIKDELKAGNKIRGGDWFNRRRS